jgi:hypothetical protein
MLREKLNANNAFTRRSLLKLASLVTLGASVTLGTRKIYSQDLPKVDPSDPVAQALAYTHNARTNLDRVKVVDGTAAGSQFCFNCHYNFDKEVKAWHPCAMFPAKLVSKNGWCMSWRKRRG